MSSRPSIRLVFLFLAAFALAGGCADPEGAAIDRSEAIVFPDAIAFPDATASLDASALDAGDPCAAIDWTADDIPEDYYPWQGTYDADGDYMGEDAPWTLAVGSPGVLVEVAPPEDDVPWQQGTDWDIRQRADGTCELVFYTAGPYTVRTGGGPVFIAGAAAAVLANGAPVAMRRARRGTGMIPGDTDLSLYSDSGGGPFGIGALAVPLGSRALPLPRKYVVDAAAAVTEINTRRTALGRPIVVAFLAHGNVGVIGLEDETITTDNALGKFFGARGNVEHQRQLSCLSGTPATPQVLELIADAYTGGPLATVGGWDRVLIATPFGFFTTGSYHEYHGE